MWDVGPNPPWLTLWKLTIVRWQKLDMVRVYTRPKGRLPDYTAPVVLKRSACTVEEYVTSSGHTVGSQLNII